jgi:hypothetical protein
MDVIYDFEQQPRTHGWFTKVKRKDVAEGLRIRVKDPDKISSEVVNLCGPAAMFTTLCRDNPVKYAKFACELFDTGHAWLGTLEVSPSVNLRVADPQFTAKLNAADWIVLASIRDSENTLTDFSTVDAGFGGITLPGALEDWYIAAGYSDVIEECNVWFNKDEEHARWANRLRSQGYRISLFINMQMLYEATQNDWSSIPTHWINLTSPMLITSNVTFTCFTWGQGHYNVPQGGALTLDGFLRNYYGFVAAKP